VTVASDFQCQLACRANPQCEWFTYNPETMACFVKKDPNDLKSQAIGVTGPRFCRKYKKAMISWKGKRFPQGEISPTVIFIR